MGFNLAEILSDVPELDTNNSELLHIDIDNLDPDPNNFYAIAGIDDLASNIEFVGLQQPLLVRPGSSKGRYTVVSGHRRLKALQLLVGEGKDSFRDVRCFLDNGSGSPELHELKLIMANSDTRKMSSADLSKQAERVESLLYKLKEQGVEFPGRMRDHVAEACKVSKSKLARLKVIRDGLHEPHFCEAYEKGELPEATAYTIARAPKEAQEDIYKYEIVTASRDIKYLYDGKVEDFLQKRKMLKGRRCKLNSSGKCDNLPQFLSKISANEYGYTTCAYGGVKCCADCSELSKCKYACPHLAEKKAELRQIRKDEIKKEKAEAAARDAAYIADLNAIWKSFGDALASAGIDTKEFCEQMGIWHDVAFSEFEEDKLELKTSSCLPYGYTVNMNEVKTLRRASKILGCSIDKLLAHESSQPASEPVAWFRGNPKGAGWYACKIDCSGTKLTRILYYDNTFKDWSFTNGGVGIKADILGWYPIPND